METKGLSRTGIRQWPVPLLICMLALGAVVGNWRTAAAAPQADEQGSAAASAASAAAGSAHNAAGNAAGGAATAKPKQPKPATPAAPAKPASKPAAKPTKATAKKAASKPASKPQATAPSAPAKTPPPDAAAAPKAPLAACDAAGKQVELVNLTFVHSSLGAAGAQPATDGSPEASTKPSVAEALNSLFQVPAASADKSAQNSDTAPGSPSSGVDPSAKKSACQTVPPACARGKSACQAVPAACPPEDGAAGKTPTLPLCPLVQDLGYGRLLLHGTPAQNLAVKRAIAAIDVAWPQVQLNIWAVQVSGRDDQEVSKEVRCIRDRISWTRDAIVRLQDRLKDELIDREDRRCALPRGLEDRMQLWRQGPMSLNEALILLLLRDGKDQDRIVGALRSYTRDDLGTPRLADDCAPTTPADPDTKDCRSRCVACGSHCTDCPSRCTSAHSGPPPFSRLEAALRMPGSPNLCSAFGEFWKDYHAVRELSRVEPAEECGSLTDDTQVLCPEMSEQPRRLDHFARSRNRIDRALRTVMDAYAADMQDLLFDPLLDSIRDKERRSKDTDGVALVGRTRIVVTSGVEASLAPEMASYVDTTRPKPFGTDLLNAAFPAKKSDGSTAAGLDRIVGGIPQVQAALLAAALLSDTEPRYLKVAPGIGIDVRPAVLPDESEARLTIDARFGVDTQELSTAKRDDLWTQPPPASIRSHHVTTDANVGVFDLFDISSFSIDTVTPQAPYYIPILGRLPILGPAFQIPRKNKAVRHESVILVNTVVLPRSTLLTDSF